MVECRGPKSNLKLMIYLLLGLWYDRLNSLVIRLASLALVDVVYNNNASIQRVQLVYLFVYITLCMASLSFVILERSFLAILTIFWNDRLRLTILEWRYVFRYKHLKWLDFEIKIIFLWYKRSQKLYFKVANWQFIIAEWRFTIEKHLKLSFGKINILTVFYTENCQNDLKWLF